MSFLFVNLFQYINNRSKNASANLSMINITFYNLKVLGNLVFPFRLDSRKFYRGYYINVLFS